MRYEVLDTTEQYKYSLNSTFRYVGQPIQCWIPAQFTGARQNNYKQFKKKNRISGAWEQYSENYCFVQNTYFLPLHHYIPNDVGEREDREIGNFSLHCLLYFVNNLFRLLSVGSVHSWNPGYPFLPSGHVLADNELAVRYFSSIFS